ncbi:MAG: hypothetical protein ACE5J4_00110 [Candidatus Aenigmatarchaeota archaeon]
MAIKKSIERRERLNGNSVIVSVQKKEISDKEFIKAMKPIIKKMSKEI